MQIVKTLHPNKLFHHVRGPHLRVIRGNLNLNLKITKPLKSQRLNSNVAGWNSAVYVYHCLLSGLEFFRFRFKLPRLK